MKNGYWHIEVHEEDRHYLTFGSPFGTYQWKRLPFGLKSAPIIFQDSVSSLLVGIPNVVAYLDDIMIATETKEEHLTVLEKVLEKLVDSGVRLNMEKCAVLQPEVTFLGYKWSASGVLVEDDPVKKLLSMDEPTSREECRQFLGLATYLGTSNVPHYSALAKPLWDRCSAEDWHWDSRATEEWRKLKSAIGTIHTRRLFDPREKVVVQSDASPTGLGAVLLQGGKLVLLHPAH